jgi:hypothetical protein
MRSTIKLSQSKRYAPHSDTSKQKMPGQLTNRLADYRISPNVPNSDCIAPDFETVMLLRLMVLLTYFNWLALPQALLASLWHTNWRKSTDKGAFAVAVEVGRSLIGSNSAAFFLPLDSYWSGYPVKALLAEVGVPMWGWGYSMRCMYFHVRLEDAPLAEQVMLMAGVPLLTN